MNKFTVTANILNFVTEMQADPDFTHIYARLPSSNSLVKKHHVTQIRSKKHNIQAMAWDLLGNVTVLYPNGGVKQYITNSEIRTAGLTL